DLITAAGPGGGPQVRVFNAANLATLYSWYAYTANFNGGVFLAAGSILAGVDCQVVTGAGSGGRPHAKGLGPLTRRQAASFYAFDPAFQGGVLVAVANREGTGQVDILTGAGSDGGPEVNIYDGQTAALLERFFAFDPSFLGGVAVGGSVQ